MCLTNQRNLKATEVPGLKWLTWLEDSITGRVKLISPFTRTLIEPYKVLKAFDARKRGPTHRDRSPGNQQIIGFDTLPGWTAFKESFLLRPPHVLTDIGIERLSTQKRFRPALAWVSLYKKDSWPIQLGHWGGQSGYLSCKGPYMKVNSYMRGPDMDYGTPRLELIEVLSQLEAQAYDKWPVTSIMLKH